MTACAALTGPIAFCLSPRAMSQIDHKPTVRSLKAFLIFLIACSICSAQTQFVTIKGKQFIAPDGKPLLLKGINLGNWLLPEGYMFKFKNASSPRLIQTAINQLIGEDEAAKFWKAYRDNY